MNETLLWVGFNAFVVVMLMVDLKVFHRHAHEVKISEALIWSAVWIALSLLFNVGVYLFYEGSGGAHVSALQFFTGYLIEKSLSVDNLFVFLLIFSYFKVPAQYQHTVLYWGILGALVMRGALILLGVTIIQEFHWVIYIFGAFLVFTGARMAVQKESIEVHPERNVIVRVLKKFIPVTAGYHETKFFVSVDGKRYATLLFVVLIVVETTDLVFAVDSIPAIFAITTDPFIVYTSNVFAILGLRALYFALAGMMNLFRFLKLGLSVVLAFVGLKMLVSEIFPIPIGIALSVVATVLAMSVLFSVVVKPAKEG
ncbi:MAG TPA: TerC family protein [Bacteroidota bacterium]